MSSDDRSPRRVLAFTGTRQAFLRYLVSSRFLAEFLAEPDDEQRDWELTASIARHPAGKALGFCCSMASDFASNGVRHSDDCPRVGP